VFPASDGIEQGDACICGGIAGDAHNVRLASPVVEKLLDRITQLTVGCEPSEQALEIRKAEHPLRPVVETATGIANESRYRSRDTRDCVHAAGDLLNIDPGIGYLNRHVVVLLMFLVATQPDGGREKGFGPDRRDAKKEPLRRHLKRATCTA
jgi:hypothetical protein